MKKFLLSLTMSVFAMCSFAQSYTLTFNDYDWAADGKTSAGDSGTPFTNDSKPADVFKSACASYVASIDSASNVYSARNAVSETDATSCGVKFGASKKAGYISFTLATPVEVDSIVFSAAMYGKSEGDKGFTVGDTTFALSAGNKVFQNCVWKPQGTISTIAIAQALESGGRFYLNGITVYPKASKPVVTFPVTKLTEEAVMDSWTITSSNTFHRNTWSTEADESGMKTPFIEAWVGAGNKLADATIAHSQITGLTAGSYTVKLFARAFNESNATDYPSGIKFYANNDTIDMAEVGTQCIFNSVSTDLYTTFAATCDVTEAGTLDLGFIIKDATSDWLAFKNLEVIYNDPNVPTVTPVEGKMGVAAAEAQTAAVAAFNENPTPETYDAANAAIAAAQKSADYYAPIATAVATLDADGLAAFEYADAFNAGTLDETVDITAAVATAEKAQTTAGSDLTAVATSTAWTCPQGNGPGTYGVCTETYNASANVAGKVMYQYIEGLKAGTYEVQFLATANMAWIGAATGDGIAQIYANSVVEDIPVIGQKACTPTDYLRTMTATVGEDGVLEYGLQNIATGGNWYVAKAIKLTLVELSTEPTPDPEPVVDPNDYTSYIANADLSTTEAWNTENTKGIADGQVKVGSGKAFDFSQTITLPAGQYKMTAQAAYRYSGSEADEYTAITAGDSTHYAKLYAETATYKYVADVKNRYEGATDAALEGTAPAEVNGKFVPNSSSDVLSYMKAGQYDNEVIFNVQADGNVKIGISKTESPEAGDYANIGAWTLYRLGDAEADPTPEIAEADTLANGTYYLFNLDNFKALSSGAQWGTHATFTDANGGYDCIITRLADGKYTIDTQVNNGVKHYLSKEAYVDSPAAEFDIKLVQYGDQPGSRFATIATADNTFLGSDDNTNLVVTNLTDSIDGELNPKAVWILVTKDEALDISTLEAEADSPSDMTFAITGPNFCYLDGTRNAAWNTGDGTAVTIGGLRDKSNATITNSHNGERWNKGAEYVNQVLTNMPNGKYVLSLNAYYRQGNITDITSKEQTNAYILVNNDSVLVNSVLACATEEANDYNTSAYTLADGSVVYGPNSQTDAAKAFANGLFRQSIEFVVTDGTITLGLKKLNTVDADWLVFDELTLNYYGEVAPEPETAWVGTDLTTGWWTMFSDYYTMTKDQTATISFKNYSDKVQTWDNWLLITNIANTERNGEGYNEYFALRADNYGWGNNYDENSRVNDFNWDTFKDDMDGATVNMTVKMVDGKIVVNATETTADGSKTYNYSYTSTAINADSFSFFFTAEKAYLTNGSVEITDNPVVDAVSSVEVASANGSVKKAMKNGKVVIVKGNKTYNVAGSLVK